MDEARRQALIARFQATALERIARIRAVIADLAGGTGGGKARTEVLRELHTLKGEARMLGFGDLSDLVHAVEERVQAPDMLEHIAVWRRA
jgi:two-component system chemotaxis sensor kinase CheA/two-component system sensor histidine kinase and response regulator WspE